MYTARVHSILEQQRRQQDEKRRIRQHALQALNMTGLLKALNEPAAERKSSRLKFLDLKVDVRCTIPVARSLAANPDIFRCFEHHALSAQAVEPQNALQYQNSEA